MVLCNLHGASAVEDERVERHVVKTVEAAACAVSRALVLVEIRVVCLHLVVAAAVTSGIFDTRGKAVVVVACALRE